MNEYVALCAIGAEKILGNEIKKNGYKISSEKKTAGRVSFSGDDSAMYRANFCFRTSDRIYLLAGKFHAENFDDLFDGCYRIGWQNFFRKDVRVTVDKVRCHKSRIDSERTVQAMIQKSIYQKLGDSWRMNSLPESGANVDVRVYIENDEATVLLDTSGEALHKRGYRTDGGEAPLRETTAAVILQEMTWRRKIPLHDAFCGSGTIAIEACLYAHNIAPGLGRNFAYENFSFYDAKKSLEIKKEEAAKIRTDVECRITGSDISAEAVQRSRLNAEHACVAAGRALQLIGSDLRIERPDFTQADFSELRAPYENGLLLGNPPYGERLGDTELARELYKKMQSLREDFPLWQMGFITSQKSFEEFFGKKADSVRPLKAGNLDTALYIYR